MPANLSLPWSQLLGALEEENFAQLILTLEQETANLNDPMLEPTVSLLRLLFASIQEVSQAAEAHYDSHTKALERKEGLKAELYRIFEGMEEVSVDRSRPLNPEDVSTIPNRKEILPEKDDCLLPEDGDDQPLFVYSLGRFRIVYKGVPLPDWGSGKSKSIFKFLIAHREQPVPKEILMDRFWPDSSPDSARNNLNVAMYTMRQNLRKVLPDIQLILFQNSCYLINPDIEVWFDVDVFRQRLRQGRLLLDAHDATAAMNQFHVAEELYQGEFLAEDRYEEWIFPLRTQLRNDQITILETLAKYYFASERYRMCQTMSQKLLKMDACMEDVHRRLMVCYARQNRKYLAIRQFYECQEALEEELEMTPDAETLALYNRIKRGEPL